MVHENAGIFEIIPILDTLEGQYNHINVSILLDKYDTE